MFASINPNTDGCFCPEFCPCDPFRIPMCPLNPNPRMKIVLLKSLLLLLPIAASCQDSTNRQTLSLLKNQISAGFDNTLLAHPLQLSRGLTVRYNRALIQHKIHSVSATGSFGFINTPEIDTRLVYGIGGEYAVHFLRRFSIASGLQANYVLSVLDYDLYEYNAVGTWENTGNLLHHFSPSIYISLRGDILQKTSFTIGAFLELRMTRLYESYAKRFMEGYVPTISLGLTSKF